MAASEFQKRAIGLIIIFAVMSTVIAALPWIEIWLQSDILPQFGMTFTGEGMWKLAAESDGMRQAAYVSLIVNFFHILKIVLWMILITSIVRFVTYLVYLAATRKSGANEISSLLKTVLSIVVYIVAFFIIFKFQYPSVDLGAIFTGSAILGVVVGLALQETLGNLFAGIALQADQPFQVGDVISIPNRGVGVVETVSWRGVKIRTFQSKLLVISNAVLAKESIEVAPKDNLNARLVFFNTVYDASPARTAHLVREALRHAENVSIKMRPIVRIRDYGESSIDWEVKYWLNDYSKYNDSDALVRRNIWYAFQREKIRFAYPTRTVYMQKEASEVTFEEKVNRNAEMLNNVPLFAPLSDDETELLAETGKVRIFAPGEPIVRAGQEGNSMFVIVRGKVDVLIPDNDQQRKVNTLGENDFFGEMSLFTGENRTATVVATEETEVLRIEKTALQQIFESNPDLVETIGEIIAERRQAHVESPTQDKSTAGNNAQGMLRSIRKFFGIKSGKK